MPSMKSTSSIIKMESAEITARKGKRATAQAVFTRRANKLPLTVDIFEKGNLTEEIWFELLEALEELDSEEAEGEEAKINNCLASIAKLSSLPENLCGPSLLNQNFNPMLKAQKIDAMRWKPSVLKTFRRKSTKLFVKAF